MSFRVYPYRWVNLTLYILVTGAANTGFMAVPPLLATIASRWSVSFGTASLLIALPGLFQIVLALPGGRFADRHGFRLPVALGMTLMALGFLLRAFAGSFVAFMLCTALAASGWGMVWGPSGTLTRRWFPRHELGMANSIWGIGSWSGQALGSATGLVLVAAIGWRITWLIYGAAAAVVALLAWLLLRSEPPQPPEPQGPVLEISVLRGLAQALNCVNRALLCVTFATIGLIVMAPTLLVPALSAKGLPPETAGVIGGLLLAGGVTGVVVMSVAFRLRRVRLVLLVLGVLSPAVFIMLFYLPAHAGQTTLLVMLALVFGFVAAPLAALSPAVGQLQPGVRAGSAGLLAGLFLTAAGLGAAVLPPVLGWIVDRAGILPAAWAATGVGVLALVLLAVFVPEPE